MTTWLSSPGVPYVIEFPEEDPDRILDDVLSKSVEDVIIRGDDIEEVFVLRLPALRTVRIADTDPDLPSARYVRACRDEAEGTIDWYVESPREMAAKARLISLTSK